MDQPSRNEAMVEKLDLPFPLLSDPRGELIGSLSLWNEKEGVSEPAIVVLDKSGTVQYLYSGGYDFSNRPSEEALLGELDGVSTRGEPEGGEPGIRVSAEEAENETVRPDRSAITLDALQPYYLGTYFATLAMQMKLEGEAKEKVDSYQELVNEYNTAIQKTVKQG